MKNISDLSDYIEPDNRKESTRVFVDSMNDRLKKLIAGKTISSISYVLNETTDHYEIRITLDDGKFLFVMENDFDDEPGVLHTTFNEMPIIPKIYQF